MKLQYRLLFISLPVGEAQTNHFKLELNEGKS